jgi:sugar lactone lactonase YvrE
LADGSQHGFNGLEDIAVDPFGAMLYWTDPGSGSARIWRSDVDGQSAAAIATSTGSFGIALDRENGRLYFTTTAGSIERMDEDGSNRVVLFAASDGLNDPRGLALDLAHGMVYWTDNGTNKVQRGSLDGSGAPEDLITTGLSFPNQLAIDLARGKIYFTDTDSGTITRANTDGSVRETLLAGLDNPQDVAILVLECSDGIDNDGDGRIDAGSDPGCGDAGDVSERDPLLPCDDGIDNDLDGFTDYVDLAGDGGISDPPGDPACKLPSWGGGEDSECQDGVNNDGKFGTDWDGGVSAGQPADPDGHDPQCLNQPWKDREESGGRRCGTGYELALLIPALLWLYRSRRLI